MRVRRVVALLVSAAAIGGVSTTLAAPREGDDQRAPWRSALKWPTWCEKGFRATFPDGAEGGGVDLRTLPDGRLLLVVGCGTGAYQGPSLLYDVQIPQSAPATGRLLRVPTYDTTGIRSLRLKRITGTEAIGLIRHSAGNTLLTVLTKFRGLGDCGVWVRYRVDPSALVPLVVRAKVRCDGKPPYNPARWPRYPVAGGLPV
jgi:hypothetical protein